MIPTLGLPMPHFWFEATPRLPGVGAQVDAVAAVLASPAPLHALGHRLTGYNKVTPAPSPSENTLDAVQRGFDIYFHSRRVDGDPCETLRAALAETVLRSAMDLDAGTSLDRDEIGLLTRALLRIALWVEADLGTEVADYRVPWPIPAQDALTRWKIQHQLFFVLIHGQLMLVQALDRAIGAGDEAAIRDGLRDLALLMEATGVAFRLSGDYPIQAYDDVVRPDMMRHDPRFSGLFYADHKELVSALRVLKRIPDGFEPELRAIRDAIDTAYLAHAHVCERFVGSSASLASRSEAKVAPDSLRGRYRSRTKAIAGLKALA